MIVYFWEKSKKRYIGWGIMALIVLAELYVSWVWSRILLGERTTLQIVATEQLNPKQISQKGESQVSNSQLSQNPFVASKRGTYYYPSGCNKAKTLSIQNMLYFKDIISAERAGFKAYSGCK